MEWLFGLVQSLAGLALVVFLLWAIVWSFRRQFRLDKAKRVASHGGAVLSDDGTTLIKSYPAKNMRQANAIYADDARTLGAQGYAPVATTWGEGSPGVGRFLALGLFAFAVRPKGALTVTYRRAG